MVFDRISMYIPDIVTRQQGGLVITTHKCCRLLHGSSAAYYGQASWQLAGLTNQCIRCLVSLGCDADELHALQSIMLAIIIVASIQEQGDPLIQEPIAIGSRIDTVRAPPSMHARYNQMQHLIMTFPNHGQLLIYLV